MEVTIDALGRILIPKKIRETLGLKPQSKMRLEVEDGGLRLEPEETEDAVRLVEKDGILVIVGAKIVGDPALLVKNMREERVRQVLGESDE